MSRPCAAGTPLAIVGGALAIAVSAEVVFGDDGLLRLIFLATVSEAIRAAVERTADAKGAGTDGVN
jgi:hypothetical protein